MIFIKYPFLFKAFMLFVIIALVIFAYGLDVYVHNSREIDRKMGEKYKIKRKP